MKISVVIPTYKRPLLLARCLGALICQQFDRKDFEVIVVSDGPDPETGELMKLYADASLPQIKYTFPPFKKGPAACRNLGWLAARGELIAFTDDDCVPSSSWLKSIWNFYDGEQEIAFTGQVVVPRPRIPTDYELNTSNLETAEFVTANCICSKKALLKVGGFDERFSIAWREDSDLHFKLLTHSIPIRKVPALVIHPVRKAPWGISIQDQKKGIYNALLYKKYPELFRKRIKSSPTWNYYLMIISFFSALLLLQSGFHTAGLVALSAWLMLLIAFIVRRLKSTARTPSHIWEMIVTSIAIPFLSVFWQLYGSFKYRVLYL